MREYLILMSVTCPLPSTIRVRKLNSLTLRSSIIRSIRVICGVTMSTNSTSERIMSTTLSVDDYFDELISLIHDDYETVDLETAREVLHKTIREEYALDRDMTQSSCMQ